MEDATGRREESQNSNFDINYRLRTSPSSVGPFSPSPWRPPRAGRLPAAAVRGRMAAPPSAREAAGAADFGHVRAVLAHRRSAFTAGGARLVLAEAVRGSAFVGGAPPFASDLL